MDEFSSPYEELVYIIQIVVFAHTDRANEFSSPYEELVYIDDRNIVNVQVENQFSSPYEELVYIGILYTMCSTFDVNSFRPLTRN